MTEIKSRFVLACQQTLALAAVAAVGVSAAGVVRLEIVPAQPETGVQGQGQVGAQGQAGASGSASAGLVSARVSTAPVEPTVRTIGLGAATGRPESSVEGMGRRGAAPGVRRLVVRSAAERAHGYATVGVTWDAGQHLSEDLLRVDVRTALGGTWSPWQELHVHEEEAPDPGTEGTLREGTDPSVVGDVDRVQVRAVSLTGAAPHGLSLAIVDPGEDASTDEELPALSGPGAAAEPTPSEPVSDVPGAATLAASRPGRAVAQPQIFSRAQWGADERLRDGSPSYGDIKAGFIHHTVNANDYDRDEVPGMLRGIYAYHTQSRGWSDIGYNFLVDRFGRIWEGRYGGIARPVIGAHTLGYNSDSFAMSAIGNFDVVEPPQVMVDAYAALFAWKLSLAGVAADDDHVYVTSRYFQAINGHRDAGSTACPGRYLYAKLAEIRRAATRIQDGGGTVTPPAEPEPTEGTPLNADLTGSGWPDLVARDATTGRAAIVTTGGQLDFGEGVTAGRVGEGALVVATGDLDGDGLGDAIRRSAPGRPAVLLRGTVGAPFAATGHPLERLAGVDQIAGVGDLDGDGDGDLVGRRDDGVLRLYRGDGTGGLDGGLTLSEDWSDYDLTTGVGDLDGDGHADVAARAGDALFLLRGRGAGRTTALAAPVRLPGSWSGLDAISGLGDPTGDGRPDLLVRSATTSTTWIRPGTTAGTFGSRVGGWQRFAGLRQIVLAGRLTVGSEPDLLGVTRGGRLRVFAHNGRRSVTATADTSSSLTGVDLLLNVGDWNGDGRGDVMTRSATTGVLQVRLGQPGGSLAAPTFAGGQGWGERDLVAAVGDVTGDGHPDLAARTGAGQYRIYPGNGRTGFKKGFATSYTGAGTGQVALGLRDADKVPDIGVRRADGTLWARRSSDGAVVKVAEGLRRYDWLVGPGDLDGDGRGDLVARLRAGGDLYLLRGTEAGYGTPRIMASDLSRFDLGG